MRRAWITFQLLATVLLVMILVVVVVLLATSMSKCKKQNAFARTAVLRVHHDQCADCPKVGEITYLGNGRWTTLATLIGESSSCFCIDGHKAKLVDMGFANSDKFDFAVLETPDYRPICPVTCCELTLTKLRYEGPSCGEDLYWSNEFKCGTVNKCKVLCVNSNTFTVTTAANYGNAGAGIFDQCGNLVGMVRCGYKGCESGKRYWRTECVVLHEGWFVNAGLPGGDSSS